MLLVAMFLGEGAFSTVVPRVASLTQSSGRVLPSDARRSSNEDVSNDDRCLVADKRIRLIGGGASILAGYSGRLWPFGISTLTRIL